MTTPTDGPTPEEPQPPSDPFAAPPAGSGGYPPPPPPPPPGDPYAAYPPPPPAGYPPAPGYGQPPVYGGPQKTNQKAIFALVAGVVGFCICGIILGPVAIVLSTMAKREIAASGGTQTGNGMATAGMVLGIIVLILGVAQIALMASGNYPGFENR